MKLTIFTPTYNRKENLFKLYNSLLNQSNKNFKWIVVDDGSNDGTDEVISKFKLEKKIDIVYYFQKNSGKHIAHNKGVELCDTELFFCVDSDDYLTKDSVDIILNNYHNIDDCIGMVALKDYAEKKNIWNRMPVGVKKSTLSDLYNVYGKKGEMALIYKTEYLKKNYFIKFEGEKFLSEEILYNKLDDIAPLYVIDKVIYIMEYLEDGITKNYINAWKNSPMGVLELLKSRYKRVQKLNILRRIYRSVRVIIVFNSFCISKNINILDNTPNKKLSVILIMPSYIVRFLKFK